MKKFTVLQNKRFLDFNLKTEKIMLERAPGICDEDLILAAIVEGESVDDVFTYTNICVDNMELPWMANPQVTYANPESRSSSVGDIVVYKDDAGKVVAEMCASIGWITVTEVCTEVDFSKYIK